MQEIKPVFGNKCEKRWLMQDKCSVQPAIEVWGCVLIFQWIFFILISESSSAWKGAG